MTVAKEISKHFLQVFNGGNWTDVHLKKVLEDVTWQEATQKVGSLNTIVALVYHIDYYVGLMIKVMEGGPLDGHDKFSFQHPVVAGESDWKALTEKAFANAARFGKLVEEVPDTRLSEKFAGEKYGTYYRNLLGVIEHTHYHLGQIAVIKKLIRERGN